MTMFWPVIATGMLGVLWALVEINNQLPRLEDHHRVGFWRGLLDLIDFFYLLLFSITALTALILWGVYLVKHLAWVD